MKAILAIIVLNSFSLWLMAVSTTTEKVDSSVEELLSQWRIAMSNSVEKGEISIEELEKMSHILINDIPADSIEKGEISVETLVMLSQWFIGMRDSVEKGEASIKNPDVYIPVGERLALYCQSYPVLESFFELKGSLGLNGAWLPEVDSMNKDPWGGFDAQWACLEGIGVGGNWGGNWGRLLILGNWGRLFRELGSAFNI